MPTKGAIDYALVFIPTYDDLPGGARFIRDNAIPFFAWTYKIVPRIAVSMFAYPHRFLAPVALLWTANMLSYAIAAGDDDDDWWTRFEKGQKLREAEEGLLPEYMQGMGQCLILSSCVFGMIRQLICLSIGISATSFLMVRCLT